MEPKLYMVRHGETDFNKSGGERIRSWMDVPLNSKGHEAARRVALFFRDKDIVKVVASDLKRTRQTGQAIARENYIPLTETGELRDWNVGEFIGMKVKDAIPILNSFVDTPDVTVPAGESFNAYLGRFEAAFQKLLGYTESHADEPVVAVTSSRNFGAAHAFLTGEKDIYKNPHSLPPGGVMEYSLDAGKGGWVESVVWPGDDEFAQVADEV